MRFKDVETGEIITINQLEKEFEILRKEGETETETFRDYVTNCTAKNGSLIKI